METLSMTNLRGACRPARKAFKLILGDQKELGLTPARADKAIDALLALPRGAVWENIDVVVHGGVVFDWVEWLGYTKLRGLPRNRFVDQACALRRDNRHYRYENTRWADLAKKLARTFIKCYASQRGARKSASI
jgi:hypothetical protein